MATSISKLLLFEPWQGGREDRNYIWAFPQGSNSKEK
jgi:hypothetical protein